MDELKRHFRKHEADMQVETPDESSMWERMEARQKQQRPKRVRMAAMRFAAAACVLLLIGLGIKEWITGDSKPVERIETTQNNRPVKTEFIPLQDTISQERQPAIAIAKDKDQKQLVRKPAKKLQPVADDYTQLVNYQLERLRRTPVYAETPDFFTEYSQQLQQMDADEAALKKDIQTYGINDQLVEALVIIHQQKLNLLKGLQSEIAQMNAAIKKSGPAGSPYYLNL